LIDKEDRSKMSHCRESYEKYRNIAQTLLFDISCYDDDDDDDDAVESPPTTRAMDSDLWGVVVLVTARSSNSPPKILCHVEHFVKRLIMISFDYGHKFWETPE